MKKKQWDTINEIVDEAIELKKENREKYISSRCGKNQELKKQVLEFLQSIEQSESENFLKSPTSILGNLAEDISNGTKKIIDSGLIGKTIANYKITELIDHGGMGSVFKAERTDDAYEKEVALKLLRKGMDTPANIARFKLERNILANLEHPNITRLLDGGVTSDGMPFLIMDFFDGTPLYEYCDQHKLSIKERLEIFKKVCNAVQHAHKNAIIHRDLKPSNILITDEGKVKVLDFGIAKLLDSSEHKWQNTQTVEERRILTLRYAAPEMIANEPITTATDTYALGILLFELLGGVHPFNFKEKKVREIERHILEDFPDNPSARFTNLPENHQIKIAENRNTSPSKLEKILIGELDAIVMKAIQKKPDARYESPINMLDDLARREKNWPISAKENTIWYRTSSFLRRRKERAGIVVLFVIIFAAFIGFHMDRITEERNIAWQEARRADDISSFLLDLFDTGPVGDTLSAAGLLEQGLDHLEDLENQSAYAGMLSVMGEAYLNFGDYEKAEQLLREAVQESERIHGRQSFEYAESLVLLGNLYEEQHMWQQAAKKLRDAYTLQLELLGKNNPQTAETLSDLGSALRNLGNLELAEKHTREAIQILKQVYDSRDIELLNSQAKLAYVLQERDKFQEAEFIYLNVIENANQNSTTDPATLATYYNNLGYLYREKEEYENAIENYSQALEIQNRNFIRGHPEIINTRRNLATSYYFLDSLDQAASLFKKNVSDIRVKYSTNHWRTASALNAVALFYLRNKQVTEAESYLKESLQIYRSVLGEDHLWTGYSEGLLAACLKFQNKNLEVADSLYQHHYQLFKQDTSEFDNDNRYQLQHLIDVYSINGQNEQIVTNYRELLN